MSLTKRQQAEERYWVNGIEGGLFDPRDPGLLSGLSVFETMRTYGFNVFRIKRHYQRLCTSAVAIGITPPTLEHFRAMVETHAAENVALRYLLTAGGQEVVYRYPIDQQSVGRKIKLGAITVLDSPSLPGNVKHGSRAEWILAAQKQEVDEVLLCSPEGEILEANRSAFFCVSEGIIRLPPQDQKRLESVTLGALMDSMKHLELPFTYGPILLSDPFEEAYVVSTLKGLSPVIQIQNRTIDSPGRVGRALGQALKALFNETSS